MNLKCSEPRLIQEMLDERVGIRLNAALWGAEESGVSEEVERSATVALFQQPNDAVEDVMAHFIL